jgi:hypothetical protein
LIGGNENSAFGEHMEKASVWNAKRKIALKKQKILMKRNGDRRRYEILKRLAN